MNTGWYNKSEDPVFSISETCEGLAEEIQHYSVQKRAKYSGKPNKSKRMKYHSLPPCLITVLKETLTIVSFAAARAGVTQRSGRGALRDSGPSSCEGDYTKEGCSKNILK